jgi:hypothetical protein
VLADVLRAGVRAGSRAGQQGADLGRGRGIVQENQHPPPARDGTELRRQLVNGYRDLRRRGSQGTQEPGEHVSGPRGGVLLVAAQVGVQRATREPGQYVPSDVLPDPPLPLSTAIDSRRAGLSSARTSFSRESSAARLVKLAVTGGS